MIASQRAADTAPEWSEVAPSDLTRRPWLAQYAAGVPTTIAYPAITLPELLAGAVERFAERPALTYYGWTVTYRAFARLVAQCANRLRQLGLHKGDRVLLLLPNVPQYPIAHFGTLQAGGIVAPLSPLLVEREVEQLALTVGARFAVVLDRYYPLVARLHERGIIERVIIAAPDEYLPWYLRLLYPLRREGAQPALPAGPAQGCYRFRRLLAGADDRSPRVTITPDDVALLPCTGGTTGLPKAVMLTHRNLIANAFQVRHWIPQLRPGVEVELAALPYFHALGTTTCLHVGVLLGGRQILVPRPDSGELLAAIRKYRPTVFPGVPMLYASLCSAVRDDPAKAHALTSLRHCMAGAAAVPAALQAEFAALAGTRLYEGYGLTEASPIVIVHPFDERSRAGTVGIPFPDTDARLIDPLTGADVPLGEPGELLIRGPQVMRGYWEHPEETARVLQDGWLHTGDIATMDADGYFAIVDRTKDLIITGGENIYPHEIEAVLLTHPQVADAVVVGIPHPLAGQIAKAYVVPRTGATLTRRDVVRYCRERLAKYKVPRAVEFRDELPRNLMGKALRRALREETSPPLPITLPAANIPIGS